MTIKKKQPKPVKLKTRGLVRDITYIVLMSTAIISVLFLALVIAQKIAIVILN
jgi:hypothetical protein